MVFLLFQKANKEQIKIFLNGDSNKTVHIIIICLSNIYYFLLTNGQINGFKKRTRSKITKLPQAITSNIH